MNKEKIKMLIILSPTVEAADEIIVKEGYTVIREKIAYLDGMFDFKLIGRSDEDSIREKEAEEMDYYAILSTIINSKWEA